MLLVVTLGVFVSREGEAYRRSLLGIPAISVPAPADEAAATVAAAAEAVEAVSEPAPIDDWITLTIKRGETLSMLIEREGLPTADWWAIASMGEYGKRLKRLKAGDSIRLRKSDGRLQELMYELGETQTLHIKREGGRFDAFLLAQELEYRPAYASGAIDDSLFLSGKEAGLSGAVVMGLADIFAYDIDFVLDIRTGDRFTVIYEEIYKDGRKLRDGNILAAEFVNQGQTVRAVRYTDAAGNASYYTPQGHSLRKAFLRAPLDFARVSSHFNLARRHPVLNRIRAHKGTDYAAPWGTAIKASGDGRVVFIGNKGGYGKVVILKHGASYETLYAHMSRFRPGLGIGSRVKQGQVIGYVGASGLATGAHLHYEFRVNGIHKNPEKVVLPRGDALPQQQMTRFRAATAPLLSQLETLSRSRFALAN
ncbi:MAG: peptidoglycan DD-metalloendopeptidase family protein [Gammaproteobacteria bacterium]|nr:peptidoglycan DD-metalloendopeptidase family protein [Gammaproteobacteria bacterium]